MPTAITTAIPMSDENAPAPVCHKCQGALSDSALRCKSCQKLLHLTCSGLDDYQLVRYAVTQASYSCANCVRTKDMEEERYDDELANIKATMAKEKSIIEQIVTEPAPRNVEEKAS